MKDDIAVEEVADTAAFRQHARQWLAEVAAPVDAQGGWGGGEDSVAVFENWTPEEERQRVGVMRAWEQQRFDAGWGALSWPAEYGGRGLPKHYEQIFAEEAAGYDVPKPNELIAVTQQLIAPTIARWGTEEQKQTFIRALLRTDLLACQLFSEPEAGSDLAGVRTQAVRDGDEWVLNGQKVWTSGALVAEYGEAICRTDPAAAKHAGLTAFMVPLDAPGVTIRPIRQMSGGATFNEVFLDGVRIPDSARLGPEGSGWRVALTTLAAERLDSGSLGSGTIDKVLSLVGHLGRDLDAAETDQVADLYVRSMAGRITGLRVRAQMASGSDPGPEASVGKLYATETMRRTSEAVAHLLGPRIAADTGEWGTFGWSEHLLGAPGYRIAGGSDEIQRNIIAERVLGLPKEPKS
ncbi:acyl-CoA dehydrogenase family protein [Arthrobacter bambusae]|uniref:acyl-CoA dehydrogenase family protein n=1 Tax=Arthrobacter bambusae TaxID=1338426 RepID=UPI00278299DF|nr:acyl-CoA dehydrogenase family protein [Arthrobacter bambusae]MDQ0242104.1 acyl-CoA dehydrogenase [Arthrobacter bambusae]